MKNRKGQAAIEFILVSLVVFFFLLFYLSLCVLLVSSEYMDYVTFMTARTMKSAYNSQDTQNANARRVFDKYVSKVDGVVRKFNLEFTQGATPMEDGVRVSYEADLFYLPPIFAGDSIQSRLPLTSETKLGREPNFDACDPTKPNSFFTGFINKFGITGMENLLGQMEDNGC